MVDAIWSDMGLRYPPAVIPLPRHATATLASASRLLVVLPERTRHGACCTNSLTR
jgi:hypothetical protein